MVSFDDAFFRLLSGSEVDRVQIMQGLNADERRQLELLLSIDERIRDDEDFLLPLKDPIALPVLLGHVDTAGPMVDTLAAEHIGPIRHHLAPAVNSSEIGRLGCYRILKSIGIGGMSKVFCAEDERLGRRVALKVMLDDAAAKETSRQRAFREARTLASLEHDNIVPIYDVGECNGVLFIAMKLLTGETLGQCLDRGGRLDQAEVVRVVRQVLTGLQIVHEHQLVHRDIKPDNIWLEAGTGRVKILDFGIARQDNARDRLTRQGVIVGTPRYCSPEQANGGEFDGRSDLFSLGIVAYQCLTGRHPFDGPTATAALVAVAHEDVIPIDELCPDTDPQLSAIVLRLLEKEPGQRPKTAGYVLDLLDELQVGSDRRQQLDKHISRSPPARKRLRKWGMIVGLVVIALVWLLPGIWWADRFGVVAIELETESDVGNVLLGGQPAQFEKKSARQLAVRAVPGKHRLQITLVDGSILKTDLKNGTVEVELGGTIHVKAWSRIRSRSFASEREIARWLVSIGARVEVMTATNEHKALNNAKLPQERFHIVSIDQSRTNQSLPPHSLVCLQHCKRLEKLRVTARFSREDACAVGRLPKLTTLLLDKCAASNGPLSKDVESDHDNWPTRDHGFWRFRF